MDLERTRQVFHTRWNVVGVTPSGFGPGPIKEPAKADKRLQMSAYHPIHLSERMLRRFWYLFGDLSIRLRQADRIRMLVMKSGTISHPACFPRVFHNRHAGS